MRLATPILTRLFNMRYSLQFSLLFFTFSSALFSQQENNINLDSLYINSIEEKSEPDKILHAEPLYIDLIRDLGARKGEKEWNIGFGLTDNVFG